MVRRVAITRKSWLRGTENSLNYFSASCESKIMPKEEVKKKSVSKSSLTGLDIDT